MPPRRGPSRVTYGAAALCADCYENPLTRYSSGSCATSQNYFFKARAWPLCFWLGGFLPSTYFKGHHMNKGPGLITHQSHVRLRGLPFYEKRSGCGSRSMPNSPLLQGGRDTPVMSVGNSRWTWTLCLLCFVSYVPSWHTHFKKTCPEETNPLSRMFSMLLPNRNLIYVWDIWDWIPALAMNGLQTSN